MTLTAKLLAWMIALPWTTSDKAVETSYSRAERLETLARAIADASGGDRAKASFLAIQVKSESSLDSLVQQCQCRDYQCDPVRHRNGTVEHLAHGPWQIHRVPAFPVSWWDSLCGTSYEAALSGARHVLRYYRASSLTCSFASLGGSLVPCKGPSIPKWVTTRVAAARELELKLAEQRGDRE